MRKFLAVFSALSACLLLSFMVPVSKNLIAGGFGSVVDGRLFPGMTVNSGTRPGSLNEDAAPVISHKRLPSTGSTAVPFPGAGLDLFKNEKELFIMYEDTAPGLSGKARGPVHIRYFDAKHKVYVNPLLFYPDDENPAYKIPYRDLWYDILATSEGDTYRSNILGAYAYGPEYYTLRKVSPQTGALLKEIMNTIGYSVRPSINNIEIAFSKAAVYEPVSAGTVVLYTDTVVDLRFKANQLHSADANTFTSPPLRVKVDAGISGTAEFSFETMGYSEGAFVPRTTATVGLTTGYDGTWFYTGSITAEPEKTVEITAVNRENAVESMVVTFAGQPEPPTEAD